MAIFSSTEKMYEILGGLFRKLLNDPDAGPKFIESEIVIKFDISDPQGTIWLSNRNNGEVICGSSDLDPTIEMTLSGDTCHRFWMQSIAMPTALAKGLIKARGPLPKVLKLLPLLKPAFAAYPDIARENNLET